MKQLVRDALFFVMGAYTLSTGAQNVWFWLMVVLLYIHYLVLK